MRIPGPGNHIKAVPGVPDYGSAQLGNINSIFKIKLTEDRNAAFLGNGAYLVSAGLAISFPTATTARIDPGPSTATVLQPFIGFVYTRNRFFAQGFGSMTLPMISIQSLILFNDVGLGLWAYRDDSPTAILSGIAPTFKAHLNVPVQGSDRISSIFNRAGTLPFNTQFNLTFGGTFEFAHRPRSVWASLSPPSVPTRSSTSFSPSSISVSEPCRRFRKPPWVWSDKTRLILSTREFFVKSFRSRFRQ